MKPSKSEVDAVIRAAQRDMASAPVKVVAVSSSHSEARPTYQEEIRARGVEKLRDERDDLIEQCAETSMLLARSEREAETLRRILLWLTPVTVGAIVLVGILSWRLFRYWKGF